MTKIFALFLLLLVAASCGGGGSGPGSQTSGERTMEEAKTCAVAFDPADAPERVAVKARKAQVECQLSEEQVMALLVVI